MLDAETCSSHGGLVPVVDDIEQEMPPLPLRTCLSGWSSFAGSQIQTEGPFKLLFCVLVANVFACLLLCVSSLDLGNRQQFYAFWLCGQE